MTAIVHPLPFTGDLIDYLSVHGRRLEWLWRDGKAYIPVRPICEILGIAYQVQHRKLQGPDSEATVTIMVTVGSDEKQREMLCIAYEDFILWLANISLSRVKESARAPLLKLKTEIKLLVAAHYHDRLFAESVEARFQLQKFRDEYVAQQRIRIRVQLAVANGLTWKMLVGSTNYSQPRLLTAIKDLMRIGAIPAPPSGTPMESVQPDLFEALANG